MQFQLFHTRLFNGINGQHNSKKKEETKNFTIQIECYGITEWLGKVKITLNRASFLFEKGHFGREEVMGLYEKLKENVAQIWRWNI